MTIATDSIIMANPSATPATATRMAGGVAFFRCCLSKCMRLAIYNFQLFIDGAAGVCF